MIPWHLDWAFHTGRPVRTPGGWGRTVRRRLADLVLPTGKIILGLDSPPTHQVNEASKVRPVVPPGRYPVWASLAEHGEDRRSVAFVTIEFRPGLVSRWESVGAFFTDSGTGCLMDETCLEAPGSGWAMTYEEWRALKNGVFGGGDCSVICDPKTGANAIVFKTYDWSYPCFLGQDRSRQSVCLVVDGRWHRWWDWVLPAWLLAWKVPRTPPRVGAEGKQGA